MSGKGNKWLLIYPRLKYACKMCLEVMLGSHPKHRPFVWEDMYDWDLVWDFYFTAGIVIDEFKDEEPLNYGKAKNTMNQHLHNPKTNSDKIMKIYNVLLKEKLEEGLISKSRYKTTIGREYLTPNKNRIKNETVYYHFKEFKGFPKVKRRNPDPIIVNCIDCGTHVVGRPTTLRCDECKKEEYRLTYKKEYQDKYASVKVDNPNLNPSLDDMIEIYNILSNGENGWIDKQDLIQHARHTWGMSSGTVYRIYKKYIGTFEEKKVGAKKQIRRNY